MKRKISLTLFPLLTGLMTISAAQVPDSTHTAPVPNDPEMVKMYVKQDPSTYQKAKPEGQLDLEFAVQLSASSRPITDKSSLSSWEELGPLYVYTENGMYKVRIGPFDTQDKAKEVLLQAKARGKKDAFIVIQKGLEGYQPIGYARQPALNIESGQPVAANPAPSVKQEPSPAVAAPTVSAVSGDSHVEYKVRLASYLKPGGFSTNGLDQYGTLESYRKGEWTILMIGGFKTEQDANKVKDQVIAKGFKDAKVVMEVDGMLQLGD